MGELQQCDMRLQSQTNSPRVCSDDRANLQWRPGFIVECLHMRPLQTRHVQSQPHLWPSPFRFGLQEADKATTQVAQGEGIRWIPRQVFAGQSFKATPTQYRP